MTDIRFYIPKGETIPTDLLKHGGGYFSRSQTERRQGTGISLVSTISVKGGLRRKDGGDPSWL